MRRCMLTRAGQSFPLCSSEWKKAGPGNNLVLQHFQDEETGEVSYHVGTIETMIACKHFDKFRLVVIMDLVEVRPVTISVKDSNGVVFSTVLSNLWEKKPHSKKERYMCPAWMIPHKTMLCTFKDKKYYCVYA